jgi:Zn-dependent peptidase ImmA (M78 family)
MVPYPIDGLYKLAADMGVIVAYYPHTSCPRGRYIETMDGIKVICLNPQLQHDEMRMRCTLAHELGHPATGVGAERIQGDMRDEARARRWARRLLLPDEWMCKHLTLPAYEIAAAAGVYDTWAKARLRDLARMLATA